ncbi:MAG: hypothetical protein FWG65_03770 [Turicibacter sp.]|nr:hypothetical protein [Turicibacter sp.]
MNYILHFFPLFPILSVPFWLLWIVILWHWRVEKGDCRSMWHIDPILTFTILITFCISVGMGLYIFLNQPDPPEPPVMVQVTVEERQINEQNRIIYVVSRGEQLFTLDSAFLPRETRHLFVAGDVLTVDFSNLRRLNG